MLQFVVGARNRSARCESSSPRVREVRIMLDIVGVVVGRGRRGRRGLPCNFVPASADRHRASASCSARWSCQKNKNRRVFILRRSNSESKDALHRKPRRGEWRCALHNRCGVRKSFVRNVRLVRQRGRLILLPGRDRRHARAGRPRRPPPPLGRPAPPRCGPRAPRPANRSPSSATLPHAIPRLRIIRVRTAPSPCARFPR